MRDRARAVIIGGGVGGASIAYHLAHAGWSDVVLVERAELTSGSTFHSAGLVGQLRSTVQLTEMMMYGVELYRRLDAETGRSPGWSEVGSLRLASTPARLEELRRQAGWAESFGLPLQLLSAAEAQERFPLMTLDGVLGAAFLPTDGYLDPSQLTFALAQGARQRGVAIETGTRVLGIEVERGHVRAVVTDRGRVETEVVVNAGGIYAPEIGRLVGVRVPIVAMAHEYLVTEPFRERQGHLPTLRDPDLLVYFREEGGGLIMGGYERHPAPFGLDGIPADFNNQLLEADWPRFEELSRNAVRRVPALETAGVMRLINGPEAFTPDGEFILGESEVRGFFVAAGFCAHGLAGAGGIGRVMAEWIVEGEPRQDLWHMDIRRFGAQYRSPAYTLSRVHETYSTYYDIRYPNQERLAGRPLRIPPAYPRHVGLEAVFGEKAGWERVNWYESNAHLAAQEPSPVGWAAEVWSPAIAAEHRATRTAAGLFDESSFAKIEVVGPGAATFLQQLCANDVARRVGQITYTQMLNPRGGIESDCTITRLAEDRFRIVTGTAFLAHDLGWIRRHLPDDGRVAVLDVTSAHACHALWGPAAREILAGLTPADLSNRAFPYMSAREITVGDVPCLALRVTYVGELGWELYCPAEFGSRLWDTLVEAGRPRGLVPGGYRAIDSLRLEKGYRVWGSDITPEDTPDEAGLGFAVRIDKPGGFIGRDALARARAAGPLRQLACLALADPRRVVLGNEPVRVGGRTVGRVTSGGYGYTVERSIAYAYLPREQAALGGAAEIEVFGSWIPAEVVTEPLWDPEGARVRGVEPAGVPVT